MSGDEAKAYMYLMCHAWTEGVRGTLPIDDRSLSALARVSLSDWLEMKEAIISCFVEYRGKYVSEYLVEVSHTQSLRVRSGKRGGRNARGLTGVTSKRVDELIEAGIPAHVARKVGKKEDVSVNRYYARPKNLEMVVDYFIDMKIENPKENAEKFFLHYESNGWTLENGKRINYWRPLVDALALLK